MRGSPTAAKAETATSSAYGAFARRVLKPVGGELFDGFHALGERR